MEGLGRVARPSVERAMARVLSTVGANRLGARQEAAKVSPGVAADGPLGRRDDN